MKGLREMDAVTSPGMITFEGFRFDVGLRRLLRPDSVGVWAPVAIGSRALDVLGALLRQPGVLVTKDAIMRQVWPGIAVEANNLTVQITALRKVLDGNRAAESCIQTVSGRGYRFVAPALRLSTESISELPERIVGHPKLPSGSVMPARLWGLGVPEGHECPVQGFIPSDRPPNPGALTATGWAEPNASRLVAPSAERRQLTVLACDVAGLGEPSICLDLEDLCEMTTACHRCCMDIIERYHGYVANYAADGVLAYFGYPQADEHDAERAIRAGLALIEAVPKLKTAAGVLLHVSVGIATGMVVTGGQVGSSVARVTAVGGTPNLAARLQGLAAADQIVIAASTRRLIGNAFELTDLGEHELKGIAEPVHGWRVERAQVTESRFDASRGNSALTPLVGREEELNLLLRRWSQTKDGEGQVVLLSGEPGIGKSRILSTLRERLDAEGVQALRFQCSPYYVNSAFWPLIDNFERTLKFSRDESSDAKLDKLEALVVTRYGRKLAEVRFVAAILSIAYEAARYGPSSLTPQKHKDETLRTLVDLVEAAARQRPSVMLFEDAHWADPSTLEVLDLLIDRVKTAPLLVVLTHRQEFQSRWSEHGHVGALNLSKLTRAQSAAMVSALAGGKALPGPLLEQILARTDGVPLFVEELTKSILESGKLKEAGDHFEYGGSARTVTIPATLRDSLMARLDRFISVKEIAQIGAAIGREFSYELIAAVAPLPQAQLDDALAQLSESGLALRRGTPPDAVYTFKHALVQDAAYDFVAEEPQTGVACQDRKRDRPALPEHQEHRTRGAGTSPYRRGPFRSRYSALADCWRAGAETHGFDGGHLPSQPGARTGLHPASVIGTRRQRTGAAHPPWHRVGGSQKLARP